MTLYYMYLRFKHVNYIRHVHNNNTMSIWLVFVLLYLVNMTGSVDNLNFIIYRPYLLTASDLTLLIMHLACSIFMIGITLSGN